MSYVLVLILLIPVHWLAEITSYFPTSGSWSTDSDSFAAGFGIKFKTTPIATVDVARMTVVYKGYGSACS